MNSGNENGNGATVQPSVMNYRKLQSRKKWLGLKNDHIAKAAGVCAVTVSRFLNGDDTVRPESQDAITRALRMRRTIDFEPLEIDRGFAESVATAGLKYSTRYDPSRSVWVIIQESALESHPVGETYGIESERMARLWVRVMNDAVSFK